ncbi:MAG: AsnC family transcriptional regulator, partial [Pseudomonadota bacterium]|nr:AsnC family transcriptional regulator [Pseudomonadota bacterium]
MQIDDTDRALLTALSDDARRSVADLARDLGLARSTVQTRIDRLERSGAIAGYTL